MLARWPDPYKKKPFDPITPTTPQTQKRKKKKSISNLLAFKSGLTKLRVRIKLGLFLAAITWFPATEGALTPLANAAALSTVAGLFKLSRSEADAEAEEEGDSPIKLPKQESG